MSIGPHTRTVISVMLAAAPSAASRGANPSAHRMRAGRARDGVAVRKIFVTFEFVSHLCSSVS